MWKCDTEKDCKDGSDEPDNCRQYCNIHVSDYLYPCLLLLHITITFPMLFLHLLALFIM